MQYCQQVISASTFLSFVLFESIYLSSSVPVPSDICTFDLPQVWEQELYQELDYKTPLAWFHTFEAHTHVAGLSFADER